MDNEYRASPAQTSNNFFYNNFFRKKTFLSFIKKDNYYNKKKYLHSIGFNNKYLFKNKKVLEVGGGSGRLFFALRGLNFIKNVKEYIFLEPSNYIKEVQKNTHLKKVNFFNGKLEDIYKIEKYQDYFDIIILNGCIPHIKLTLNSIFKINYSLLNKKGILNVVTSYYHHPKTIDRFIKKIIFNEFLIKIAVILKLIIEKFSTKSFFEKFFIKSYQKKLKNRFNQYLEFYSINPYNIFYNYQNYLNVFNKNNFYVSNYYPYSIAIKLIKKKKKNFLLFPKKKETVIYSIKKNDYVANYFSESIGNYKIETKLHECLNKIIIIAYSVENFSESFFKPVLFF
jgi:SAM-dependent methyltransferase